MNKLQIEIRVRPISKVLSVFKSLTEDQCLITFNYKFMEIKHYVGVDVSKNTLDFALIHEGIVMDQFQCENNKKSISQLIKQLRRVAGFSMTTTLFCMEYTGVYNNVLLDYLLACKSPIWLESALQIKQSQGLTRGKSDEIDAVRIAQYAFLFRSKMKLWTPPREELNKLRALIVVRDRVVNGIKELSVRMKENARFVTKEIRQMEAQVMKRSLAALEKTLQDIDEQIKRLIKSDPALKQMHELITSVTGVGPIVAINVIVATDEFKKITNPSSFSCYSGVAPFEHRSGTSIRGRSKVSHLANKKIKTLLHLAAMSAIHAKGEMQDYYKRKVGEGKNKMCVLNAVRNKIIHRIFAVINRQTPYEKNYSPTIA